MHQSDTLIKEIARVIGIDEDTYLVYRRLKGKRSIALTSDLLETESDEEHSDMSTSAFIQALALINIRKSFHVRTRFVWQKFISDFTSENQFSNFYRMSYQSFIKLRNLLKPMILVDESQSQRRTGTVAIDIDFILHCTLRYMTGGQPADIRACCGISKSSFYRCLHNGLWAINQCSDLEISFPESDIDVNNTAEYFRGLCRNDVMKTCVGAVDGWLCRIRVPAADDVPNVRSFFSGHYNTYGVNVQACCDGACRFTHVSMLCPAGTNDVMAFDSSTLKGMINSLPPGYYIVGDNAYVATNKLLTPYAGRAKRCEVKDAFNFYLSQLRIRIEQAFGMLVNKWRVFSSPLNLNINNVHTLVKASMRLHIYCINEREYMNGVTTASGGVRIIPDHEIESYREEYIRYQEHVFNSGRSTIRDIILCDISQLGLRRPTYNRLRNAYRD